MCIASSEFELGRGFPLFAFAADALPRGAGPEEIWEGGRTFIEPSERMHALILLEGEANRAMLGYYLSFGQRSFDPDDA